MSADHDDALLGARAVEMGLITQAQLKEALGEQARLAAEEGEAPSLGYVLVSKRFIVTEAWVAENDSISEGVFVRVKDNGVRCITTPCPTIGEKALNTSRSATVHGLDWDVADLDEDQVAKLSTEMVATPYGIIIAGDRYTFKENNQNARGRTVTAAYRRYEAAQASVRTYERGVIERSEKNVQTMRAAYQVGAFRVSELLAEQRRLVDMQREMTEALAERYRALAELRAALGITD